MSTGKIMVLYYRNKELPRNSPSQWYSPNGEKTVLYLSFVDLNEHRALLRQKQLLLQQNECALRRIFDAIGLPATDSHGYIAESVPEEARSVDPPLPAMVEKVFEDFQALGLTRTIQVQIAADDNNCNKGFSYEIKLYVGQIIEAYSKEDGKWYTAEVIDIKPVRIRYKIDSKEECPFVNNIRLPIDGMELGLCTRQEYMSGTRSCDVQGHCKGPRTAVWKRTLRAGGYVALHKVDDILESRFSRVSGLGGLTFHSTSLGNQSVERFWKLCKSEARCHTTPYNWLLENPILREDYRQNANIEYNLTRKQRQKEARRWKAEGLDAKDIRKERNKRKRKEKKERKRQAEAMKQQNTSPLFLD